MGAIAKCVVAATLIDDDAAMVTADEPTHSRSPVSRAVTSRRERARRALAAYDRGKDATNRATARALATIDDAVAVVLVEGVLDQVALQTAAVGRDRDLDAEGVAIVPIGGAHAIGRFLTRLGPLGTGRRLAGLCDLGEEAIFRRGLAAARVGSPETRADMERLGFYVCVSDLEDELIRALGTSAVEEVFASHGDLRSFRLFQSQPAWRGREPAAQLHRFIRSSSVRNLRYARLLVEAAVGRETLPWPLEALLSSV